jgi:hypothetical protein
MSNPMLEPASVERPGKHGQADTHRGKRCDPGTSVRDAMRAFSVVVGPSVVVDFAGAASLVATATAARAPPGPFAMGDHGNGHSRALRRRGATVAATMGCHRRGT